MNEAQSPAFRREMANLRNLRRSPAQSHFRKQKETYLAETAGRPFPFRIVAFLRRRVLEWAWNYLKNRFGPKHDFLDYRAWKTDKGIYKLSDYIRADGPDGPQDEIRISLAGDWGTGTEEAFTVAQKMIAPFNPHYTIHLGDVYYVGDKTELNENCLGVTDDPNIQPVTWPVGLVGSLALNGNHEMYANGDAYFDLLLPHLGLRPGPGQDPRGQRASFFCLYNDFWLMLGVDTGYNSVGLPIIERLPFFHPSCKLQSQLISWLRDCVEPLLRNRGIIVFSHHQYLSSFEDEFPKPAKQLAEFIHRPVLWFWGHEHRMAAYGKDTRDGGIEAYGRCIGHGGMPVDIKPKPNHQPGAGPLVIYDHRRDPDVKEAEVGLNGFVKFRFRNNQLLIEYLDLKDTLLLTETWEANNGVLVGKKIDKKDPNLTQYHPDLYHAIR